MRFCERCGTRLRLRQIRMGEETHSGLACDKCGFYIRVEKAVTKAGEGSQKVPIKVIDEKSSRIKTMPTTTVECPKCGNTTAYWWFLQTRGGDEPTTQFYRCSNETCNHTWRVYA